MVLLAGKAEKLSRQVGGAPCAFQNLLDIFLGRMIVLECIERQRPITQHPLQKVVEVMRHPSGKLTDGVELLRLAELFLKVSLGREIPR